MAGVVRGQYVYVSKEEFLFCGYSYSCSQDVQRVTLQSEQSFFPLGLVLSWWGYQISLSLLLSLGLAVVFGRRRRICEGWSVSMRWLMRLSGCEDFHQARLGVEPRLCLEISPLLEGFFANSHGEITVDFAVLALFPHLH